MPVINIENVQIKTVAIEIKALTVNNRQVTQSVFKQIPEEHILDLETVTLKGLIWGHVNFQTSENLYHLIWQKGKELRRCLFYKSHDKDYIFSDVFRDHCHQIRELESNLRGLVRGNSTYFTADLSQLSLEGLRHELKYSTNDSRKELINQELQTRTAEIDLKNLEIEKNKADFLQKSKKLILLIDSLADLPQLFIAV